MSRFARLADPAPSPRHAPCVARRPRPRHRHCPCRARGRPRHPEGGRPPPPLRGHRRLPRRRRPADGRALHAPPDRLPARPAADRIGAAGLHLGQDLRHLGPGRAAHAGAPAAAARHARPHAGHQGVDVAGDELGLHRDLAHELLLQHRRRRRHLLRRSSPSSSARCCIRTTATPRSASRCATSASPRAPTARLRLEEKGTVYNEMVASMANGAWQAWRAQNHAVYGTRHTLVVQPGRRARGHPHDDARRTSAASTPPRHHLANMGTVAAFPKSARARRPAGALRPRADEGCAEGRARARPTRSTSCRRPPATPKARCASTSTRTPTRSSPARWRWCGRPTASSTPPSSCWPSSSSPTSPATPAPTSTACSSTAAAAAWTPARARSAATVGEWGGHPVAIDIDDVRPAAMTDEGLRAIRSVVVDEIQRIAAFADGSAELKAFNERDRQPRRRARAAGAQVPRHAAGLRLAQRQLGLGEPAAAARALARRRASRWCSSPSSPGCGPCSPPTATSGARPSRAGRSPASCPTSSARGRIPRSSPREQAEREARLAEETERLKRRYGTTDAQQALARHAADADAELARIDKATAGAADALREVAADDARRRAAVRVRAPGQRRAAGRLALRQHDRRDHRPGAAPRRRAARTSCATCRCCPSCSPASA